MARASRERELVGRAEVYRFNNIKGLFGPTLDHLGIIFQWFMRHLANPIFSHGAIMGRIFEILPSASETM
jgi:hypothetical protein